MTQAKWKRIWQETHISLPIFAFPLLLAIWLVTNHLVETERQNSAKVVSESLKELADTYEAQVIRNLGGIDQTLKAIQYSVELTGSINVLPELERFGLLPSGLIFVIVVADRDGKIVASNPGTEYRSLADQKFFQLHQQSQSDTLIVKGLYTGPSQTEWHLNFSRRLNDAQHQFTGVVMLQVEPGYFTSGYERSRFGDQGLLGLLDVNEHSFLARQVGDTVSWGGTVESNVELQVAPTISQWDTVKRYTHIRRIHGYPVNAVVGLSVEEQANVFNQRKRLYILMAAIASAGLILAVGLVCGWSWHLAKARRKIQRAQETYAAASEANLDAFFVLHVVRDSYGMICDFAITATNSQAENLVNMKKSELLAQNLCELFPECRSNGIFNEFVNVTRQGGVHELEWENDIPAIKARWLRRQVVAVDNGVVAIIRDISERKFSEEKINFMAHHDILTGLPNRSLITDRLNQAIYHAQRIGCQVGVAFIDLDSFKLINDGLGHNAGDDLLKIISDRISRCMRRGDTVGRFGGDEFVIILPDVQESLSKMVTLVEKIRLAVTQPMVLMGQQIQISCSIGVSFYPADGENAETLMLNADAAMYCAKGMGKNNYQFYLRDMNANIEEKLALIDGLRHALSHHQFQILYQPQIDLRTGLIFGAEALLRWLHPQHGLISPIRFIPLAEESGLIVEIGAWVLSEVCKQNKAWQLAGLPPIITAVNVSPRQFEDQQLIQKVSTALHESGLPPEYLELEVTESLIMRDLQRAVEKMQKFKAMGVSMSIDDFGTGYSSLSALKSFPISRLKIDKSFVRDLKEGNDDQAIVMAVISLAHKLNLRVIAEGVETEEQLAFLREQYCDEMQGYLFSKPVPAEQIVELLEAQASRNCLKDVAAHTQRLSSKE